MRILTKLFPMAVLLLSFVVLTAEEKPNFSGDWTLNNEKSQLGEGGGRMVSTKLNLVQKGDSLTLTRIAIRQSGEEFKTTEKITLDGKECVNTVFETPKKSTAVWSVDGKSLTVTSAIVFERDGNKMEIATVEIFNLTDEGESLSIEYSSKSPRGERKGIFVYDRKSTP